MWFKELINNSSNLFFQILDNSQHDLGNHVSQLATDCGVDKIDFDPGCKTHDLGTYCLSETMTHVDGYGLTACEELTNTTLDCIGRVLSCGLTRHDSEGGFDFTSGGALVLIGACCFCLCCASIMKSMSSHSTNGEENRLLPRHL